MLRIKFVESSIGILYIFHKVSFQKQIDFFIKTVFFLLRRSKHVKISENYSHFSHETNTFSYDFFCG